MILLSLNDRVNLMIHSTDTLPNVETFLNSMRRENAFIHTLQVDYLEKKKQENSAWHGFKEKKLLLSEHLPKSRVKITFTDPNINKRYSSNRCQNQFKKTKQLESTQILQNPSDFGIHMSEKVQDRVGTLELHELPLSISL